MSQSSTADFKLDFFTPSRQIAHCGHATIATFNYLNQQGLITNTETSKETIDGNRSIQIKGNQVFMEQLQPSYSKDIEDDVPSVLQIDAEDIVAPPLIVNTGNSFLIVQVKDYHVLKSIMAYQNQVSAISERHDLIGFYIFTTQTHHADRDASTRMFAPRYGISEESATGMAAGPLACYLYDHCHIHKNKFLIEQGYAMPSPSPSCIEVNLFTNAEGIYSLAAGGYASTSKVIDIDI